MRYACHFIVAIVGAIFMSSTSANSQIVKNLQMRLTIAPSQNFVDEDWEKLAASALDKENIIGRTSEQICTFFEVGASQADSLCFNNLQGVFSVALQEIYRRKDTDLEVFWSSYYKREAPKMINAACVSAVQKGAVGERTPEVQAALQGLIEGCYSSAWQFLRSMRVDGVRDYERRQSRDEILKLKSALSDKEAIIQRSQSISNDQQEEVRTLKERIRLLESQVASSRGSAPTSSAHAQPSSQQQPANGCVRQTLVNPLRATLTNTCARNVLVALVRTCFTSQGQVVRTSDEIVPANGSSVVDYATKFGSFCADMSATRTDGLGEQTFR